MNQQETLRNPISVHGLSKSFGRRKLWSNVSFDVPAGRVLALSGPSGSGKTTLLNAVGLLEPVDEGRIAIDGRDALGFSNRRRRIAYRDSIGFLFQNSGLVDNWTVRDNITVAMLGRRWSAARKSQECREALAAMGVGDLGDARVHTLSGGEQQRVGLARLLVKRATIVLADEPTASLDDSNAEIVISSLRALAAAGAAVLISTHDPRVQEASDGVLTLTGGSRENGARADVNWTT